MSRTLVSGSIAYDRIMDFPGGFWEHLFPDKLHSLSVSFTVDSLEESFGGVAGNIAYNLALLGEHPEILATAGSDFDHYKEWMQKNNINTDSIQIVQEVRTATAHIISDVANNQIAAFYLGALAHPYTKDISMNDVGVALVGAGNLEDMVSLPEKYRAAGVKYLFDPGQQTIRLTKDQLERSMTGAYALIANDYEMEVIRQATGQTNKELLRLTPMIVTTLGAEGATVTTQEKEIRIQPVQIDKVVDPTGAGDAHRAGFIKGMLAGLPIEQICQLASVVASFAVEVKGSQGFHYSLDDVRSRYQKTYGETVAI